MRKVLIVSYEFPPRGGSGVQRVVKLAKYLPHFGWQAHILTAQDIPTAMYDETLLRDVPDDTSVKGAFSLEPTRLYRLLAKLKPGRANSGSSGGGGHGATNLPDWAIRMVQFPFAPDEKIGWLPWAVAQGLRMIREEKIDAIISTSPPATTQLVARALCRRTGLPWIADFRDPWVGNEFKPPLSPIHHLLDKHWEARVIRAASLVTSANGVTADSLRGRYPEDGGKFHTITNGFDPEDFVDLPHVGANSGFSIVHTGTFYAQRNPASFLKAVRSLIEEDERLAADLEIRFVGPVDANTVESIKGTSLEDRVVHVGYVDHKKSIAHLKSAAALLLIVSPGPESERHLAGKIFEYLASKKPILALVGDGEAAELVNKARAGVVVHPDDIEGIKKAVSGFYQAHIEGTSPVEFDDRIIAEFDRRVLAKAFAGLLGAAIEKAADPNEA